MTIYDGVILVLLLISGIVGYARGGAKEIVTLFAFLIAALISALMLPYSGPFFRGFINPQWVGTVVAAVLIFVVAYLAVHAIGGFIRSKMHQSDQLGGIDRTVGLGVGLIRALAFVGAFHLMLAAMTANRIPDWFRHAALYKVSAFSAKTIQVVLPPMAKAADSVAPRVEASVREGATGRPQSKAKGAPAYDRRQRQDMDALVERTR
ncbi:MAG: CvpA family protein [Proteobacteria bacterium]|nr:CvpA family protein [Pseudomonadota bacterium]